MILRPFLQELGISLIILPEADHFKRKSQSRQTLRETEIAFIEISGIKERNIFGLGPFSYSSNPLKINHVHRGPLIKLAMIQRETLDFFLPFCKPTKFYFCVIVSDDVYNQFSPTQPSFLFHAYNSTHSEKNPF